MALEAVAMPDPWFAEEGRGIGLISSSRWNPAEGFGTCSSLNETEGIRAYLGRCLGVGFDEDVNVTASELSGSSYRSNVPFSGALSEADMSSVCWLTKSAEVSRGYAAAREQVSPGHLLMRLSASGTSEAKSFVLGCR